MEFTLVKLERVVRGYGWGRVPALVRNGKVVAIVVMYGYWPYDTDDEECGYVRLPSLEILIMSPVPHAVRIKLQDRFYYLPSTEIGRFIRRAGTWVTYTMRHNS